MMSIRNWAVAALSLLVGCIAAPVFAAAPALEAYGRLPAVEQMLLSPSGKRFAFITVVGDKRELVIANVDDGKPIMAGAVGDSKVRGLEWVGDEHVLVDVAAMVDLGPEFLTRKQTWYGVAVFSLNGSKSFTVFQGSGYVAHAVFGEYGTAQIDGHWYGYFGGATLTQARGGGSYLLDNPTDLYQVNLDTGDTRLFAHGKAHGADWLIGPRGEFVARTNYDQVSGKWAIFAGATGETPLLSGLSPFGAPSLAGFAQSPDSIVVSDPEPNNPHWEVVPLAGGAPQPVQSSGPVPSLIFDGTTRLWLGKLLAGDQREMVMFDPALQAKVHGAAKAFANYRVEIVSHSDDFNRMIVFTDGGTDSSTYWDDSGTYWLVDVAAHSAKMLGEAYPDIKEANVAPVRMVDWKASDGLALRGVLTLPPGRPAKALPIVVLPHGGPVDRDYPRFDWWAQALASRGYAVFQPNFRGSSDYGHAFFQAGLGEWGRKMQTDVSDGLAALAAQGIVDPKRACIVGASYGGYAALAGVTVQHGLYRCAVAYAGVADLRAMLRTVADENDVASDSMRFWKAFMGVTNMAQASLSEISPVELADRADAPILLIHGKDDTTVRTEQSYAMERALRRAGKSVELIELPDEDHYLSRQATRQAMLNATVAFVQKYNPAD